MMFDDGELMTAGSPFPRSVALNDGDGNMLWESRVDPEGEALADSSFVRAMVPRSQGGVIAAVQGETSIMLDVIETDGQRLTSFEIPTGPTAGHHFEMIELDDGFALSVIETKNDQETLTLRKLNTKFETVWTHQTDIATSTLALPWFDGGLVQLPSGDLVQVASAQLESGKPGTRFLRVSSEGITATDVELELDALTHDIAMHPSGDVFVLVGRLDHIEALRVDPLGEVKWAVRPREGYEVEASHIAWDDHTQRLLIAGGTRPTNEAMHGYWVVLNERGGQEWSYVGGPSSNTTEQLLAAPNGGFVTADWSEELRVHQFVASTCH